MSQEHFSGGVYTAALGSSSVFNVFLKCLVGICPFMGHLIPLFWNSGDVSSGFQSQSGQPYWHLAEACMYDVRALRHNTCQPLDGQHGSQ